MDTSVSYDFGQCVSVLWSSFTSGCTNSKISEPIKTTEYGNKTKIVPPLKSVQIMECGKVLAHSIIWMNGQTSLDTVGEVLSAGHHIRSLKHSSNIPSFINLVHPHTPARLHERFWCHSSWGSRIEGLGEVPSTPLCQRPWVPSAESSPGTQTLLSIFNLVNQPDCCPCDCRSAY